MAASKTQNNNSLTNYSTNHHQFESWQVSTTAHRAWLASGCTTLLISLARSISLTFRSNTDSAAYLKLLLTAIIAYLAADLATGIYHWAIDNYGNPQTLVFGSQIVSFQGHHQQPWAITKRQLANNLYIPAAIVTTMVMPANVLLGNPVLLGFISVFAGCIMFSQQFHAWAHTPKRKLLPLVVALQEAGLLVARGQHAAHHKPPYNNNYCIVSGTWNRLLDCSKFFLALEVVIFRVFGIKPRSWNDPSSDWIQGKS